MDRVALDDEAIWEKLSGLERDMNATTMTSDERVRDVQRQLDMLDTVIREERAKLNEMEIASHTQMPSGIITDLPIVKVDVMQNLEIRIDDMMKLVDSLEATQAKLKADNDDLEVFLEVIKPDDIEALFDGIANATDALKEANLVFIQIEDLLRQSQREYGDLLDFKIELTQSQQQIRKKFSMLEYVAFGQQDRRDFEFEKAALVERISKVEYEVVKLNGASNRIVHFIKNFVISITNIENRLQPLLEEAISTHTMNELKKRVDAAWQELQKMKQDSESMDSTVTQFKQIHENAKQINLDQLNAVVTSLRAQDQEQARNTELVVARIDKEIDMLTSDHDYMIQRLNEVRHTEINEELLQLKEEIDQINVDNEQLRETIADLDLSLDPLLSLGDPSEMIKRICKTLLVDQGLIDAS